MTSVLVGSSAWFGSGGMGTANRAINFCFGDKFTISSWRGTSLSVVLTLTLAGSVSTGAAGRAAYFRSGYKVTILDHCWGVICPTSAKSRLAARFPALLRVENAPGLLPRINRLWGCASIALTQ